MVRRPIVGLIVVLGLAACTAFPRADTAASTSLNGHDTLPYPPTEDAHWGPLPPELAAVLADLPDTLAPLDRPGREVLAKLSYAHARQKPFYARRDGVTVWIRRFPGRGGAPDGLALQIAGSCNRLPAGIGRLAPDDQATLNRSCSQRQRSEFDSGLLLFLLAADGRLQPAGDVPGTPFPQLDPHDWQALRRAGASPPFADIATLARTDAIRLLIEPDPERGFPPGIKGLVGDSSPMLHGGFVVWTGDRFELRQQALPEQWPCRSLDRDCETDPYRQP